MQKPRFRRGFSYDTVPAMETTVTITSLGQQGDGLAQHDGHPLFVARAAVGDTLRVELPTGKDAHARIVEVVKPGAGRIDAPCPHYERCGGCQLQHLDQPTYQAWKENAVHQMLTKAGVEPETWLPPVFIPNATRRRVTFAAIKKDKVVTLGLNQLRSHQIEDLTVCLLLTPALENVRANLKPYLLRLLPEGKLTDISLQDIDGSIELILTGDFGDLSFTKMDLVNEMAYGLGLARIGWRKGQFDKADTLIAPLPTKKMFGKLQIDIPPASFLQPSREGEDALVAAVLDGCKDLKRAAFADLFAGSGTFTGHLLQQGTVYAAENEADHIDALKKAGLSMAKKLQTEKRDLFKEPLTFKELNGFDCVVFDPPRAGAQAQAATMARAQKLNRIIAVSCNPVTFIRDAELLIGGGYQLKSVQLVDQFIWSAHSELVGVFSR